MMDENLEVRERSGLVMWPL